MIVLDTNVVSVVMDERLHAKPIAWLDRQSAEMVWTTSVSVFEVRYGINLLPVGRRRDGLERGLTRALDVVLQGRVLAFDAPAAEAAAVLAIEARRRGLNIAIQDIQIGGIVASRRATLATRNLRDFAPLGVGVVDPWA